MARLVRVGADRLTVSVRGARGLADFSRATGKGLPQPTHGDMRTAKQRDGEDWQDWSLDVPTLDQWWPEWWVEHQGGYRRSE